MSSLDFFGSPSPLLPGPHIDEQRFAELDRRIAEDKEHPPDEALKQAVRTRFELHTKRMNRLQEKILELRELARKQQAQINALLVVRRDPVSTLLSTPSAEVLKVLEAVAGRLDSSVELIRSRYHARPHVTARHMCMLVLRRRGMSLTAVGWIFDRDHSTVLHGTRAAEKVLESNEDLRAWVHGLMEGA